MATGFKQHYYTVLREDSTSGYWNGGTWVELPKHWYMRGFGIIQPTTRGEEIAATGDPTGAEPFSIKDELTVYTKDHYPALDGNGDPSTGQSGGAIGTNFHPDYVIWNEATYFAASLNLYSHRDSRREVGVVYSSAAESDSDLIPLDIDWQGLDKFKQAVISTEMVVELKLAKTLEDL